jgi:cytochrome c
MANMEVNKAFSAILVAGIAFMVTGLVGQQLVHVERPHESAIQIGDVSAAAPTQAPAAEAPKLEPITPLLASANVQNGQTLAQRLCASCHSFNEGGRNGVGPNLYSVIGAPHGHAEGFSYSAALKGKQGPWTYEDMNAWLLKPSAYAAGTRMAFAGIASTQQRADVIAYLKSISPKAPEPQAQ